MMLPRNRKSPPSRRALEIVLADNEKVAEQVAKINAGQIEKAERLFAKWQVGNRGTAGCLGNLCTGGYANERH